MDHHSVVCSFFYRYTCKSFSCVYVSFIYPFVLCLLLSCLCYRCMLKTTLHATYQQYVSANIEMYKRWKPYFWHVSVLNTILVLHACIKKRDKRSRCLPDFMTQLSNKLRTSEISKCEWIYFLSISFSWWKFVWMKFIFRDSFLTLTFLYIILVLYISSEKNPSSIKIDFHFSLYKKRDWEREKKTQC